MAFITVKQASEKWGISERRIRTLCVEGRIDGVFMSGKTWNIPDNAQKPTDARVPKEEKTKIYFNKVDELKSQLDSCRPFTQGEMERLNEDFMVMFTYDSNAIGGNSLSGGETALVLQGVTINQKSLKDHMEAIGHKKAFEYITEVAKTKEDLSEDIIKKIHSLVLLDKPEDRGVYRKVPVSIIGSSYNPPQQYILPKKMEDLILKYKEWKNTRHIIEQVALMHLEFESIHPFIDGNGRTGRLLINLQLMQAGFPPIDIKQTDITRYFKAFEDYQENQNEKPMVNLIKEYVLDKLEKYINILS